MSAMEVLLAHGAPVNGRCSHRPPPRFPDMCRSACVVTVLARPLSGCHVRGGDFRGCMGVQKGADAAIKNKEGLTPHGVAQLVASAICPHICNVTMCMLVDRVARSC
eukprot:2554944-Rhodomonas_salina.2